MSSKEALLVRRLSVFLRANYPNVIYRFDQIDQIGLVNGKRNKELHGRWSRGFPDLVIYKAGGSVLMLELKAEGASLSTKHVKEQIWYHSELNRRGYIALLVVGYDRAVSVIKNYLGSKYD